MLTRRRQWGDASVVTTIGGQATAATRWGDHEAGQSLELYDTGRGKEGGIVIKLGDGQKLREEKSQEH